MNQDGVHEEHVDLSTDLCTQYWTRKWQQRRSSVEGNQRSDEADATTFNELSEALLLNCLRRWTRLSLVDGAPKHDSRSLRERIHFREGASEGKSPDVIFVTRSAVPSAELWQFRFVPTIRAYLDQVDSWSYASDWKWPVNFKSEELEIDDVVKSGSVTDGTRSQRQQQVDSRRRWSVQLPLRPVGETPLPLFLMSGLWGLNTKKFSDSSPIIGAVSAAGAMDHQRYGGRARLISTGNGAGEGSSDHGLVGNLRSLWSRKVSEAVLSAAWLPNVYHRKERLLESSRGLDLHLVHPSQRLSIGFGCLERQFENLQPALGLQAKNALAFASIRGFLPFGDPLRPVGSEFFILSVTPVYGSVLELPRPSIVGDGGKTPKSLAAASKGNESPPPAPLPPSSGSGESARTDAGDSPQSQGAKSLYTFTRVTMAAAKSLWRHGHWDLGCRLAAAVDIAAPGSAPIPSFDEIHFGEEYTRGGHILNHLQSFGALSLEASYKARVSAFFNLFVPNIVQRAFSGASWGRDDVVATMGYSIRTFGAPPSRSVLLSDLPPEEAGGWRTFGVLRKGMSNPFGAPESVRVECQFSGRVFRSITHNPISAGSCVPSGAGAGASGTPQTSPPLNLPFRCGVSWSFAPIDEP
jgi:hypothetical protein